MKQCFGTNECFSEEGSPRYGQLKLACMNIILGRSKCASKVRCEQLEAAEGTPAGTGTVHDSDQRNVVKQSEEE